MEVSKMASEKMLHLLVIQVIHSFYEVLLMMAFSKKQSTVLFVVAFWYFTFK